MTKVIGRAAAPLEPSGRVASTHRGHGALAETAVESHLPRLVATLGARPPAELAAPAIRGG